jgi:hypothetical protein
MTVDTTESLKIGALQHLCLGHRLVPVEDYLKPKVFSVGPSTRVMAPSKRNVVAYNSVGTLISLGRLTGKKGALAIVRRRAWLAPPHAFDA